MYIVPHVTESTKRNNVLQSSFLALLFDDAQEYLLFSYQMYNNATSKRRYNHETIKCRKRLRILHRH